MTSILAGMDEWSRKTCIRFRKRTTETDYAYFTYGSKWENFFLYFFIFCLLCFLTFRHCKIIWKQFLIIIKVFFPFCSLFPFFSLFLFLFFSFLAFYLACLTISFSNKNIWFVDDHDWSIIPISYHYNFTSYFYSGVHLGLVK